MRTTDPLAAADRLVTWAEESGLEVDRLADTHAVVSLPGEKKLKTTVSVKCSPRSIDLQAFVIRHADENHGEFHAWLLHKNSRLKGLAFATDKLGDVYLNASVPPRAWDDDLIDEILGKFLSAADESFNELLIIGFLTSMKKEWAWRVTRGESTRNLAAFEHLLAEGNEYLET